MDNFKKACILKLRFQTSKGPLSAEQLFELNQTDLATACKNQKKLLRKTDDDDLGFLDQVSVTDEVETLKFDILKDVYLTKKADAEAKRLAKENKEHNNKILELIASKKDEALTGMSIEQLEAMLK
jgi:hypothetical protein